jgi:ankyrin repeat protein
MKKALFFLAPVSVLTVFCLFVVNCKSAPDIWALLRSGDERAPGYFLSEVEVNAVDPNGKTPLHYAAERQDAKLASFFISLGAKPDALDNNGQSPLGISVENNDPAVAAAIVSGGANIHLQLANNNTAASLALTKSPALFKALLTPASIASVDSSKKNVLHLASIAGNVQAVTGILEILPSSSASINALDNSEKNALDYALNRPDSRNHIDIAEQLILSGANSDNPIYAYFGPAARSSNFNIRRNEGLAPIHHAIMNNHAGLISFLFDKNVDINIKSSSGATPLHEAMRTGNIDNINMLLEKGANVNAVDAKGNTPLHTGIPSHVHREVVTILLNKGADPNLRDEHGDTPLHIAVILNRSNEIVQAILNGGSDVHIRNIDGKTPLYIAVQEGRTTLIPVLLSYGSEVFAADNSGVTPFDIAARTNDSAFNLLVVPETVNQRDAGGNTMLHAVVKNRGNPIQLSKILEHRAQVDARNSDGDTALHLAVRMNQRENGEFLISRAANIFSVNSSGESPLYLALSDSNGVREWIINPNTIIARDGLGNNMLHYAAQWGLNNAIPTIIRYGIPVNEGNATGETPLFYAAKTDSVPTIKTLLENNANLGARDTQGNSVLHAAVRWNAEKSAALFISSGIDINVYSLNGNTPLHDAVALGMSDIETLLIKEGANLEVRNVDGNTPLMEAVRGGIIPSIEKLIQNGADTSTRNIRGDTPLHIAVGLERLELVNILLRSNASIHARNTRNRTPFQLSLGISPRMVSTLLTANRINIPDDMGNSALHIALQERVSADIIRTIITQGARLNAVDNNGKSPLRVAVDMELWEQAKALSDAGADPFLSAVDNRTPAEISFAKGEVCTRALFSGRAINSMDSSGNTILHLAARYGNPETINILLQLGANRTIKNIASEKPFDIAIRWNKSENADLLR